VAWVGFTSGAGGSGGALGFLARGPGFVEYLALSGDSGAVEGRAVSVQPSGVPPAETAVGRTEAVHGRLSPSQVELSIGGAQVRRGVRTGISSFVLEPTGTAGHRAPLVFHRASPAAFEAAVAGLDGRVRGANRSADQRQAVDDAGVRVAADLAAVSSSTNQTATAVGAIAPEVQSAMGDLTATVAQESQVGADVASAGDPTSFGAIDACFDVALVADDAAEVVTDAEVVEADALGVQDDVDQLRRLVAMLEVDAAALRRNEATLRSYRPASVPSLASAHQDGAAATTAAGGAVASTNRDIAAVNGAVRMADADAMAASGQVSCGIPPPPPAVTEPSIP
jgi:hypothetical protein